MTDLRLDDRLDDRLDYQKAAPDAFNAMLALETAVRRSGLEHSLIELVKMRVSQINGCAYCLDMHSKDARAAGETEQRLHLLAAWREAPFYTERERAALAWAEALTLVASQGASDAVYQQARAQFDAKALVDLTLAIVAINGWNRLAIPFRSEVVDHLGRVRAGAAHAARRTTAARPAHGTIAASRSGLARCRRARKTACAA